MAQELFTVVVASRTVHRRTIHQHARTTPPPERLVCKLVHKGGTHSLRGSSGAVSRMGGGTLGGVYRVGREPRSRSCSRAAGQRGPHDDGAGGESEWGGFPHREAGGAKGVPHYDNGLRSRIRSRGRATPGAKAPDSRVPQWLVQRPPSPTRLVPGGGRIDVAGKLPLLRGHVPGMQLLTCLSPCGAWRGLVRAWEILVHRFAGFSGP